MSLFLQFSHLSNQNPRRISSGGSHSVHHAKATELPLPLLRDLDQPFIFNVRMYNKSYRFEFYDTAAPENYTLLNPDFVIICYAIDDRRSLTNAQQVWKKTATRTYMRNRDDIPVMLLGLKRDRRVEGDGIIYPQEVSGIAQAFGYLLKLIP